MTGDLCWAGRLLSPHAELSVLNIFCIEWRSRFLLPNLVVEELQVRILAASEMRIFLLLFL
jgi:hypothetical protein